MNTFQKRFKIALERKEIKIPTLARKINYTKGALYHLLKDEVNPNPSLDLILALCEVLEVTPNWLLGIDNEPDAIPTPTEDAAYDVYVDVLKQEYFASRTELEAARTIIESQKQTIEQLKAQLGFDSNLKPKNKGNNSPKKAKAVRKKQVTHDNYSSAVGLQQNGLFVAL